MLTLGEGCRCVVGWVGPRLAVSASQHAMAAPTATSGGGLLIGTRVTLLSGMPFLMAASFRCCSVVLEDWRTVKISLAESWMTSSNCLTQLAICGIAHLAGMSSFKVGCRASRSTCHCVGPDGGPVEGAEGRVGRVLGRRGVDLLGESSCP